jgi:hypothetical protein
MMPEGSLDSSFHIPYSYVTQVRIIKIRKMQNETIMRVFVAPLYHDILSIVRSLPRLYLSFLEAFFLGQTCCHIFLLSLPTLGSIRSF